MLVLVASTGAAVSVACDAASSVGAVGDALASHPDVAVPRRDQLLIFEGRRLEGETRTLAEYGLPERAGDAVAAEDEEPRFRRGAEYVFLYRKSALISEKFLGTPSRDGDPSSRDDPVHGLGIVSIDVAPTPPPPRSDGSHPLERAAVAFFVDGSKKIRKGSESDITKTVDVSETSSRLHRLVALERSLEHAAARVEATHAASTARARAAATLTRATRVRALAADAASASAETHLAAALAAHAEFMRRANERVRFQSELLSTFEDDLETLRATTILSDRKTPPEDDESGEKEKTTSRETKTSSLLDLVAPTRLREKRDAAKNAHDAFVAKLHALDSRVTRLKTETELLFMTLPEVDVEALEAELESARDALRAQNVVVDEVRADAATARAIAARCVEALAESSVEDAKDSKDSAEEMADSSASTRQNELQKNQLLSALSEIEVLSRADATHSSSSFARVAATDDVLAAFHAHCATCASAMDANARALLVKIAETQNEIAKLRDARFAFEEIADRTEKPFCFLFGACRALPARHAACLAEKKRREAYADRLAARARRAADLFAADREEERERRDAFRQTLERVVAEERFFGRGRTEKSAFSPALDAVTRATLGSATPAPSVEITVRGVPRAEVVSAPGPEPEKNAAKKDDVDEALAAVFAESL